MKKMFVITIAVFLFFPAVFSCRSISSEAYEPRLSIKSVEFAEISYNKLDMIAWLDVENPNSFDLPFPKIDWELFINSDSFIRGGMEEGVSLRRRRTTAVPVHLSFTYEGLYSSMGSLVENKEAAYSIAMGLAFDHIEEKTFRLEYSGSIPLIEVPKISPSAFRIADIDFSGIDLAWGFNVENPNPFQIPFPNMEWEYAAGGITIGKSTLYQDKVELPPGGVSPVEVMVSIKYADLMTAAPSLANAREAPSLLSINYEFPISSSGDVISSLEIPGTIPIIKMPMFTIRGINRKSLANQKFEFAVNMELENRNAFPMNIESFNYELKVSSSVWARGSFQDPPVIRADSRTALPMTVVIDAISNPSLFPVILEIHDIIQRGISVNYECTGSMVLSSEFPGLPRLNMPVSATGTSRLLQ